MNKTMKLIDRIEYSIKQVEYLIDNGTSIDYQLNGLSMTLDEKQAYLMGQVTAMKNIVEDLKLITEEN